MKIFVGGLKPHHQQRFALQFPSVTFHFATLEDTPEVWCKRALHVDAILIDQSRTDHKKVQHMQRYIRAPMYFTDSKAVMRKIINDFVTTGRTTHYYAQARDSDVGIPGSQTSTPCSKRGTP